VKWVEGKGRARSTWRARPLGCPWGSESPLLTRWPARAWLDGLQGAGLHRAGSLGERLPGLISGQHLSRLLAQGGEEGEVGGHEGGGRRSEGGQGRAGVWPRLYRAMADGAIPEPELPAAAGRSTHGEPLGPAVVSVSHERELAFPCDPRLFRHCKQRGAVRARVRARVQDCSDVVTAR